MGGRRHGSVFVDIHLDRIQQPVGRRFSESPRVGQIGYRVQARLDDPYRLRGVAGPLLYLLSVDRKAHHPGHDRSRGPGLDAAFPELCCALFPLPADACKTAPKVELDCLSLDFSHAYDIDWRLPGIQGSSKASTLMTVSQLRGCLKAQPKIGRALK